MRALCCVLFQILLLTAFLASAAAQEVTQGPEPNLPALQEENSAGTAQSPEFPASAADANVPRIEMIVRDSYLPGVPVLVRIEILRADGTADRDVWDANAVLWVTGNPSVRLDPNRVALYNGLGSALVAVTGGGDFELTADVNGMETTATLADWSGQPVHAVSGTLSESQTWTGVYRITGGDLTIPKDVTLTLEPGTLVLLDGVASGTGGTDIDIEGSIQSLGTAVSPVTFTAATTGRNWGELHHDHAQPSLFRYTEIMRAGRAPGAGHTGTGPALRVAKSSLTFDHASVTDNAGKIMQSESGSELTFTDTLFSRSVMGPEIAGTSLLFERGGIIEMRNKDDADGIYIHSQQSGQTCRLTDMVIAGTDDDGIDTLGSKIVVEDSIIRGCKDKAVSVFDGETTIRRCLLVRNNLAPEDPTIATIAAKTTEGATTVVNLDHITLVASRAKGHVDAGIQSHNKYGVKKGTIIYNVTNSIIDATEPVSVQAPYLLSDMHLTYCDIVGVGWPGLGNLAADPQFLDPSHDDYHLADTSTCLDAAGPDSLQRDIGYYQTTLLLDPNEPTLGSSSHE
jgi:hypothetical protein